MEESVKRKVTKRKTGPHPLAKRRHSALVAKRSASYPEFKEQGSDFFGLALGGPLHSFLRRSSGYANVKMSYAKQEELAF